MTTILRKLLVLGMVAIVFVFASIHEVVRWLTRLGIPEMADNVADRYLTGTTVATVLILVFLLRSDRPGRRWDERPRYPPEHNPPRYPRRPWWW